MVSDTKQAPVDDIGISTKIHTANRDQSLSGQQAEEEEKEKHGDIACKRKQGRATLPLASRRSFREYA